MMGLTSSWTWSTWPPSPSFWKMDEWSSDEPSEDGTMDWPSPTECAGAPVEPTGGLGGMDQLASSGFAGGAHGFRWGSGVNCGGGPPDAMPPDAMPLPKPPPPKTLPPNRLLRLLGVDMWPENLSGCAGPPDRGRGAGGALLSPLV
jgi:hypothetical protein